MSRTSEQTKFEATMQRYVCHQRALDGRTRQPDLRQRARRQAHPLRRAVYPAQADRRVRYRRRDAKREAHPSAFAEAYDRDPFT